MQVSHFTRSVLLTALVLFAVFTESKAQTIPSAMFVNNSIEVCEFSAITAKLQFTGEPTFILHYRIFNVTTGQQAGGINILEIFNIATDNTADISISNPELDNRHDYVYEIQLLKISNNDYSNIDLTGTTPLKINSYKKPTAAIIAPEKTCGFEVNLIATDNKLVKPGYRWDANPSGIFSDPQSKTTNFTAKQPTNIAITLTESNGVCTDTDEKIISIQGNPEGTISGNAVICTAASNTDPKNITIDLQFKGTAPFRYRLSTGNEATTSLEQTQLTLAQQGPNTITLVKITDGNGCEATQNQMTGLAKVTDRKPTPQAGPDDQICGIEYVLKGVRSSTNNTLQWDCISADCALLGQFNGDTDIEEPIYQSNTNTTIVFRLQETNNDGSACVSNDEVAIRFHLPIEDVFAGPDTTLYMKQNMQLQATKKEWETGNWSINTTNGTFEDATLYNTKVSNLEFGSQTLTWTVSNGSCAPVSDNFVLEVKHLTWPNGFSPNGDGVNDKLIILGAENIPDNNLTVFSLTGKAIFSMNNYGLSPIKSEAKSSDFWWDANGVPDGFYYYIFKAPQIAPIKESLTIKRTKP